MKGRTNYLCRHRFQRLREAEAALPTTERRWMERIGGWAKESATGDRAEIEGLPDEFPLWTELSSNADQCLGRDCPEDVDCFITRMRESAANAEVVIVNHHLLCADAAVRESQFGEVIPECEVVVVDEAHQLEDIVTQYFGVHVGVHRVEELVRDARPVLAESVDGSTAAGAMAELHDAARRFFDRVRAIVALGTSGERWLFTSEMAASLEGDAEALRRALGDVMTSLSVGSNPSTDFGALAMRAAAIRADLDTLLAADDPAYVHFVETRGRSVTLRAAPIDAAPIIRRAVVGERHAVVFLSATLAIGGSFDYALGRLGVEDADTVRLPSEFDYATQALLYLPPDLPDPRLPGFNAAAARRILELLELSDGRAFVLFTSYAALREVRDWIEPRLRWPLLVQGAAPRATLLRDFRTAANAVLLATSSFWQGVDVAGDALSAVIIDRLPFASPVDPLVAARMAAIEARDGHPFAEYQVPVAILALLQGLGRLIRTRTDRGLLSVLDPRVTRMAYGRRFVASMPAAPVTASLAEVARFFAGPGPDAAGVN